MSTCVHSVPRDRSPRRLLSALLCLVTVTACLAAPEVSSSTRFEGASVAQGKDVIDLSKGGKVGYRVLRVSATDSTGKRTTTDVAVWYPTSDAETTFVYDYGENTVRTHVAENGSVAPGRYPLVVFSHGANGSGLTSAFVTETMARHGFIVAAVDHTDEQYLARIQPTAGGQRGQAIKALAYAAKVRNRLLGTDAVSHRSEVAYRPAQIKATIDLFVNPPSGSQFAGHVDTGKIGVMGHSFGGWTALATAGGIKQFADSRVKAAVTLSAPVSGFTPEEVSSIRVPVMMMFGSTEVRQGRGDDRSYFYDRLSGPKYMVEIEGAEHITFSGGVRREHPTVDGYLGDANRAAITRYAIAMMGWHLKGDENAHRQLQIRGSAVTNYIYQE